MVCYLTQLFAINKLDEIKRRAAYGLTLKRLELLSYASLALPHAVWYQAYYSSFQFFGGNYFKAAMEGPNFFELSHPVYY